MGIIWRWPGPPRCSKQSQLNSDWVKSSSFSNAAKDGDFTASVSQSCELPVQICQCFSSITTSTRSHSSFRCGPLGRPCLSLLHHLRIISQSHRSQEHTQKESRCPQKRERVPHHSELPCLNSSLAQLRNAANAAFPSPVRPVQDTRLSLTCLPLLQ